MKLGKIHFIYIQLILIFLMALLIFYWALLDGVVIRKVLNVDKVTYQTTQDWYNPGDQVFATVVGSLCKNRNVSAKTFKFLTDGISLPYDVTQVSIPVGCIPSEQPRALGQIPSFVGAGMYVLNGYYAYEINPIRISDNAIKIPFTTNSFEIRVGQIK